MDELKRPTPVGRRLNLTQAVVVKLIPMGLLLTREMASTAPSRRIMFTPASVFVQLKLFAAESRRCSTILNFNMAA